MDANAPVQRDANHFHGLLLQVRLAMELYLPALAMEKRSRRAVADRDLTWEGIRFTETVHIFE